MKPTETDLQNNAFFWFASLENALRENDFHRAGEAQQQLLRLGMEVRVHLFPLPEALTTEAAGQEGGSDD